MLIEQAIFASAETDRAQGYQLLARSRGLAEAEARELAVWGPSHGSLLSTARDSTSTNYFRLASGAHCVSRSSAAGTEYSGRGGSQVYTQFLVVPPDAMQRFANDPFAVLRAAAASGALCVRESLIPETLEPISLGGRAPVVDLALVARLAREPGPAAIAALVQAALDHEQIAVQAGVACDVLIAGLLSLLPVECRGEFSFSTGLQFSPSRPVRILALPADESAGRALARHGITPVRLDETAVHDLELQGWAAWVFAALQSGKLSLLAAELERPRPGLTAADLPELGNQLLDTLSKPHASPSRDNAVPARTVAPSAPRVESRQRADRAHLPGVAVERRARSSELDLLAERLAEQPPEVLEILERIDDLVFAAISGDSSALAELEALWPAAAADLDPDLVEQTREQYLRCALSIYTDFDEGAGQRPERAMSAVEVLCVLFEQ